MPGPAHCSAVKRALPAFGESEIPVLRLTIRDFITCASNYFSKEKLQMDLQQLNTVSRRRMGECRHTSAQSV